MTSDQQGHPAPEIVDRFVSGALPVGERRQVEGHVDGCPSCRRALALRLSRWSELRASEAVQSSAGVTTEAGAGAPAPAGTRQGRFVMLDESGTAHDTVLDRKVRLRFLSQGPVAGPVSPAQAVGDAMALAGLSHPHVARVHDMGQLDGKLYLALELVDGVPLSVWRSSRARSARDIAVVMAGAARGLAAAHARGVVHGGVTSQSILVTDQRAVVTGFAVDGRTGVDRSTDVRCFAEVLYEVVNGRPPQAEGAPPPRSRALNRLHRMAVRLLEADPSRPARDLDAVADELLSDPGRHLRRVFWVGAAAGVTAAAFAIGGVLNKSDPEQTCLLGVGAVDGVWNQARRSELERRYAAASAQSSWPVLARLLDRYATGWRAMYRETCAFSASKQPGASKVFDLRIQCLDGRRASLDAFVGALGTATPRQLMQAPGSVLPEIADCGVAGRQETKPLPSEPGARAQIAAVEKLLARSQAEQNLGDFARADASCTEAIAAARKLAYEPLLAAALVRCGTVKSASGSSGGVAGQAGGLDQADALLAEAYAAAEVGGDARQRLAAASQLVLVHVRRDDIRAAERWAQRAEALLARLEYPPADGAVLFSALGGAQLREGKDKEAAASYKKALDLARSIVPPNARRVAIGESNVCRVIEDVPERIACARRAAQAAEAAYGPDHPDLAVMVSFLAEALALQPSTHAEACTIHRKAYSVLERAVAPNHQNAINTLLDLGQCLQDEGEIAEAVQAYERAIASNPVPFDAGVAHGSLGFTLSRYGDREAAVKHLRLADQYYRQIFPPCHVNPLISRQTLISTLTKLGKLAEARKVLEEVLATCLGKETEASRLATLQGYRGMILVAEGRAAKAVAAYRESLRLHAAVGTEEKDLGTPLVGMGDALLALGKTDEALTYLERAFKIRPPPNMGDPELRADGSLTLARALIARGRARGRACALAREAADGFRKLVPARAKLLKTETIIARYRCASES